MDLLSASVATVVDKARTSWLKNNEVLELLEAFSTAGLSVCQEPPVKPSGGQLFLFDRRICRFFRRDGHTWRKKPDGKTIRETHEKLKVGNVEMLNCYYAHADSDDGLQRRCYWQLDQEKEHIVLVHYLCCASSRAGTQRATNGEVAGECTAARPHRALRPQHRRAYSPPLVAGIVAPRRGGSQPRLSHLLASSSSLESELVGQDEDETVLQLSSVQGMMLEAATTLPSLAQQYAMQQAAATAAAQHHQHLLQFQDVLQSRGSGGNGSSGSGSTELDPFGLPATRHHPHPGVLYTDQRVATQLASAQQSTISAFTSPPPLPPRPLVQQESFTVEQHKTLFREMSLGIQREVVDEAGYYLGSPTSEHDPLVVDKAAAGTPGPDLASLLSSPPHGSGHRRSFSRQGSGLSRLISKNWESDVMELMLPDVDADMSAYPVESGVVVEVAERPSSPSSRLFDQAGIAFFGSAHNNATTAVQHALEPSPLGIPGLSPIQPGGAAVAVAGGAGANAARHLPFASPLQLAPSGNSPMAGPGSLQFVAGEAHALAQRTTVHNRLQRVSGMGSPRSGSHSHLAHLAKRSVGPGGEGSAEEQEQRRKERVDAAASAAASAAQEHRDEKLAAVRSRRAASSTDAEDMLEMIDIPENMQRLSSFLSRGGGISGGRLTVGREVLAAEAAAVADLELETCSLLKHMSIDEMDAAAAVRDAAKELEVMPTIYAAPSSELDVASAAHSLSEELGSRNQSVSSLLEGMQASTAGGQGQALDPISEQLKAAMAQHAARRAR